MNQPAQIFVPEPFARADWPGPLVWLAVCSDGNKPARDQARQYLAGMLGSPETDEGSKVAFSLAHGGGQVWMAAAASNRLGLDATLAGDFAGDYPLHRVFTPRERRYIASLAGIPAAAILFAAKEAAVKALGQGFGRLDYRDVECCPQGVEMDIFCFWVHADENFAVWCFREGACWLAIALPL